MIGHNALRQRGIQVVVEYDPVPDGERPQTATVVIASGLASFALASLTREEIEQVAAEIDATTGRMSYIE